MKDPHPFNQFRIEMLTDLKAAEYVHDQYRFDREHCICGMCFGILEKQQLSPEKTVQPLIPKL